MYRQTARSAKVREASRAKLLAAARRLLSRHGYAKTTMRDIARSARSSIGNLYFYFDNKDALIRMLFAESRRPVWEWADRAAAAAPQGATRMAIITYANIMRLLTTDRDLMRLISQEDTPRTLGRWAMQIHLDRLRGMIEENYPDYPVKNFEFPVAMWSGGIRRILERVVLDEIDAPPEVVAEYTIRWNLRGLGVGEEEIASAVGFARKVYEKGRREEGGGRR